MEHSESCRHANAGHHTVLVGITHRWRGPPPTLTSPSREHGCSQITKTLIPTENPLEACDNMPWAYSKKNEKHHYSALL